MELIAYIYNVSFSLGFNAICGRMQTVLNKGTIVNAQAVELARFWGMDEIKVKHCSVFDNLQVYRKN